MKEKQNKKSILFSFQQMKQNISVLWCGNCKSAGAGKVRELEESGNWKSSGTGKVRELEKFGSGKSSGAGKVQKTHI